MLSEKGFCNKETADLTPAALKTPEISYPNSIVGGNDNAQTNSGKLLEKLNKEKL